MGGKDLPDKQRGAAFIAALQRDLNAHLRRLGSPRVLAVDGVWDPHTDTAFKRVTKILGLPATHDTRTFRLIGAAAVAPGTLNGLARQTKADAELEEQLKRAFAAERTAGPTVVVGGRSLPGKELAKAYIAGLQRDLNTQLKWLGSTKRLKVDGTWDPATDRAFHRICTILGITPKRNADTFRKIAGATAQRSEDELRRAAHDGAAFEKQLRSFFALEPEVLVTQAEHHGAASGNGIKTEPKLKPKPGGARTFRVRTPEMKGDDVLAFQRVLNQRYKRWKINLRIGEDREYGTETRTAVERVAFGLGIVKSELEHGVTPELRRKIRDPRLRTPGEIARAKRRRGWVRKARRRYRGGQAVLALAFARKQVGVRETSTNRGPKIDEWTRQAGLALGNEWCGIFMNACLMAAGFPRQTFLPVVQNTENHAKAGIDGWLLTHSPKPGDLAMYTIKGAANHVGMVEQVNGSQMVTIEGNTLADHDPPGAPPDGVERRHRSVAVARSFARPPYAR